MLVPVSSVRIVAVVAAVAVAVVVYWRWQILRSWGYRAPLFLKAILVLVIAFGHLILML